MGYPPSPTTFRDFHAMFPDDDACVEYLAQWRWPDGFVCPGCEGTRAVRLRTRPLWQCSSCRRQTSVTAGTVLHRTKLPLTTWLYALWLLARRKVSTSAYQFQKETGIGSYKSAWGLLHKVRLVLAEGGDYPLHRGSVEVDESMLPGVGGHRRHLGRGGAWILGAVERIDRPGRRSRAGNVRLQAAQRADKAVLQRFIRGHVRRGARVVTDGLGAYRWLGDAGYEHEAHALNKDYDVLAAVLPQVHLLFTNVKAWLVGTFHGVCARYLDRYLREYAYRFNRRRRDPDTFGFLARRVMRGSWTGHGALRPSRS